jgi:general secretion pathway protein D
MRLPAPPLAVRLGAASLAAASLLAGCANFPALKVPPGTLARSASHVGDLAALSPPQTGPVNTEAPASPEAIAALSAAPSERIDVELPPQPLPQMLNTAFGDLLKVPYVLGPNVSTRTEVITLRGVTGMSKRDFARMLEVALRDYALKLVIRGGAVNVIDDPTPNISSATYLGHRPSQDTPQQAQVVTQFYEAKAVDIQAALALMGDIEPAGALQVQPDTAHNSVFITGRARDVAAAIDMLHELDQPMFAGVGVVRIEPVYWSAEMLARRLEDQLRADGYSVTGSPQAAGSILILAYPDANQVLMFAKDPALLSRARDWASRLDQAAAVGDRPTTFIYQARNTDAKSLADLVQTPLSGGSIGGQPSGAAAPAPGLPGGSPAANAEASSAAQAAGLGRGTIGMGLGNAAPPPSAGTFLGGRVIVDDGGNRILFTGNAEDYTELRKLLEALDKPQRQVLVEVTIAEVTLTDATNVGMEWFFSHSMSTSSLAGGTLNGLGLGASGLNLNYTASWGGWNLQAAFNAFASNNKVNILSRPRLVARSGSEASIQVGTDVPIITSQTTNPTVATGPTNVLQSIEYRQTGTILHIKPVVYGDDRVDLFITQEVSSQQPNPNTAVASPLILDRNITTQLSLADGATAVLGGLIDNEYTKGNSGIPILKDIPILSGTGRTDTISGTKDELVVLVTPFILHENEMSDWAGRYGHEMNRAFKVGYGWSYTLTSIPPLGADGPRVSVP